MAFDRRALLLVLVSVLSACFALHTQGANRPRYGGAVAPATVTSSLRNPTGLQISAYRRANLFASTQAYKIENEYMLIGKSVCRRNLSNQT